MASSHIKTGKKAEMLCMAVLVLKGYRIIQRHFVTGRGTGAGEVDIIARKGKTLAFIEVKARKDLESAAFAISATQRKRICRAAEAFLKYNPHYSDMDIRFDAMLVAPSLIASGRWPEHIENAWLDEGY